MSIVINDVAPRVHYTATAGQTVFVIPFEFLTAGDIKIWINGILHYFVEPPVENWQYSLTGIGVSGGGSATFGAPGRYEGDQVVIVRDMPIARAADLPTHGVFPVESLNQHLDALTAMVQQTEVNVQQRTLRLVEHDEPVSIEALPLKADRANKHLKFDADGQPVGDDIQARLDAAMAEVDADRIAAEEAAAAAALSEADAEAAAAAAAASADLAATYADEATQTEAYEHRLAAEAAAAQAEAAAAKVFAAASTVASPPSGSTAVSLLSGHNYGFALDFTAEDADDAVLVRDAATPANSYSGNFLGAGIVATVAQKLCVQRDGSLRFSTSNRMTYSNVFSHATWTKTAVTLTAGADGGTTLTSTASPGRVRHGAVAFSGTYLGMWYTTAVLAKPGTAGWLYINPRNNSVEQFCYFNLAGGVLGTVAAGAKAFIYSAATNPYPEIDIPDGYYLCGVAVPMVGAAYAGDIGFSDADASDVVTVGRTMTIQKAQVYYGVHPQSYMDVPATTVVLGPAYDWTHGQSALLLEPTGSYSSLWSDDFTQATWVKTNCTAVLNATGPHGQPCSTLTATAASASALQTVAAAASYCSAYVRRKTGSGTITFTVNGTTGQDITALLADRKWHRVSALGTNPDSFGLLIATSGDEVEVALANRGTFAALLSPWPIYATSGTLRAADTFAIPSTRFTHAFPGIVYLDTIYAPHDPVTSGHFLFRYGNTAKTSVVSVSMQTTGAVRYLQFLGARLYLPQPSERLEITMKLKAADYTVSVNGEPPLLQVGVAPSALDNMWIGDGAGGQIWLRRLVSVANETFDDTETIYWRYSGETGDVGLKKVAVVARQTSGVNAVQMQRYPCVTVLWQRETEAGIYVNWGSAGTAEGASIESPAISMARTYVYNRVTNTLTPTSDAAVVFTPPNYPTDGVSGGPMPMRVLGGPYKGRMLGLWSYAAVAADPRVIYMSVNDSNGNPAAWVPPGPTALALANDGIAMGPPANGGYVHFPPDHPTYPNRIVIPLIGTAKIRGFWTDTGGGVDGTDWTVGTALSTTLAAADETMIAASANFDTIYAISRITNPGVFKRLWCKSVDGGETWTELALLDAPELYSSGQVEAELHQLDPESDFGPRGRLMHARGQTDTNYAFRTGPRFDYALAEDAPVFEDAWLPFYHGRYFGYVAARRLFNDHVVMAVEGGPDTTTFNNVNHMYLAILQPPWPGFGGSSQPRRYTAPDQ